MRTDLHGFEMAPAEMLDGKLIPLDSDSGVTVLTGGAVYDGQGNFYPQGSVEIVGNRVSRVSAEALAIPNQARVVDVSGCTVLPGLIDCHIHFMGKTTTDSARSAIFPSRDVKFFRAALEVYQTLASGVTTVRALGHGRPDDTYALREAVESGLINGPRILTSGWAISQTRGHGDARPMPYEWVEEHRPRAAFADGPLEVRKLVRRNFGEGADVIKVYTSDNRTGRPDFTLEELEVIVEEAHRRGKRVAAHAKTYEGVRNALLAGIDTIEHGPSEVHSDLIELMLERDATLVPTLATVHLLAFEGEKWSATPETIDRTRREYEGRLEVIAAAAHAGVRIAAGSDTAARANYGTLLARELRLLTEAGLTPGESVVAATGASAQALGIDNAIGTLAPGMLADIVVFDGDLASDLARLEDRSNIRSILQTSERWDTGPGR